MSGSKVALLLAFDKTSQVQTLHPPLTLGYLAAYLRAYAPDVDVRFFLTADEAVNFKPDLVGISSASQNLSLAAELAESLKRQTDAPLVLGGIHISLLPQTLPRAFDIGVVGEGERTLVDLVRWRRGEMADLATIEGLVLRDGDRLVQTPPRAPIANLDEIPFPDIEMLGTCWRASGTHRTLMYSSRGCPYKCYFCSTTNFWRTYRFFSPEYVIREIEWRHATFGTRWFDFWDDLFIGDDARFRRFAEMFLERGLRERVILGFSVRSNLVTPECVRVIKDLGVEQVNFGAESGNDRVLRAINKTSVTVETNQRAIDLLHDAGVFVNCSFVFGFPDETYGEMKDTLKFIERNKYKLADIGFFPLQLLPGTRYWEMALEKGIVSLDMDWRRLELEYCKIDLETMPYLNTRVSRRKLASILARASELRAEIGEIHQRRIQPILAQL
jgi:radical SAM superfamily enzyme YgiQ (UPF0313 family)